MITSQVVGSDEFCPLALFENSFIFVDTQPLVTDVLRIEQDIANEMFNGHSN